MKKSLVNLEKELNQHKNPENLDDYFGSVMKEFIEYANEEFTKLNTTHENMGKCVHEIIIFFGEDPKKTNSEDFFSDICIFCTEFENARADLAKMREAKKREEKLKDQKEKEKRKREQREKERKFCPNIEEGGDGEGVLDGLMEALKTGQAFNRDNNKKRQRNNARDPKTRGLARGRSQIGGNMNAKSENRSSDLENILTDVPTPQSRTRSKTRDPSDAAKALKRLKALS